MLKAMRRLKDIWGDRKSTPVRRCPRYSYDKNIEYALRQWEGLAEQGKYLVHGIDLEKFERGSLSKKRAVEVFKSWDVFSTSVIDVRRISRNRVRCQKKGGEVITQMFGEVGLILDVPPQNILGAFPQDVLFPTHFSAKNYAFAGAVFNGTSKVFSLKVVDKYNKVSSPRDVIGRTVFHNEVLVVGKPDLNMHCTMTQPIKVLGILYAPKYRAEGRDVSKTSFDQLVLISRLRRLNPELAVMTV